MSRLKTELQDAKYSGLTDQHCLDLINAKNIVKKKQIQTRDIRKYLMINNKLLTIEASTTNSAKTAVRAMEIFDSFDMTDSQVVTTLTTVLDSLITDTLITTADKTAVLAMGDDYESIADQLGFRNLSIQNIERERA